MNIDGVKEYMDRKKYKQYVQVILTLGREKINPLKTKRICVI